MRAVVIAAFAVAGFSTGAVAQERYNPDRDPVRIKNQDSRQYRNEPKGNASKRDTRCKIIVKKGQDKRICGVHTNPSPSTKQR